MSIRCLQLPQDLGDAIADVAERVSALERADGGVVYTAGGQASFPGGVDTEGVGDVSAPPPTFGAPDDPTGLGATPGALFDDIYADVSWTAPGDLSNVAGYELWLERVDNPGPGESLVLVDRVAVGVVTSTRLGGLRPNTTYDVTIHAVNPLGALSSPGSTVRFTTGADNTVPAQVTGLALSSGVTTVVGVWDENTEDDVRDGYGVYELQIDTVATFNSGNLRTTRVGGTIASIGDLDAAQQYHGRVRAIDASGNAGPWSATATATADLVETAVIADLAVVEAKIGNLAVTTAKVNDLAVTRAKIADLAVDAAKIDNATITNAKIANATITGAKIATATIDTANIANAAIEAAQIAALAVGTAAIADLAVTQAKIANLAVGSAQIADLAVTQAKIANLAVDTAQIANAAITNAKIGALAVDTAEIADAAITNAKIDDLAVTNGKIANATITDAKIANLTVDKVLAGTIAGKEFILSNSTSSIIRSAGFVAGSAGWRIRGNGDAEFSNVTVRGTVTSSTITSTTITGGTIRTASSGRRIVIDGGANLSQIIFYSATATTSGFIGWDNSRLALVMDTRAASATVADIILDAENDIAIDALGIVRIDPGNIDGAVGAFQVAENGTTAFMVSRDGNESRWWFSGENNDYIGYDNVAATEKLRIVMNNTEEFTLTNVGLLVPNVYNEVFGTDPSVTVSTVGQLHRNNSSLRLKADVVERPDLAVDAIRPLEYRNTRTAPNGAREHSARVLGLGAEDVVAALGPSAGFYDDEGRVEDFNDRAVLAALIADVQAIKRTLATL